MSGWSLLRVSGPLSEAVDLTVVGSVQLCRTLVLREDILRARPHDFVAEGVQGVLRQAPRRHRLNLQAGCLPGQMSSYLSLSPALSRASQRRELQRVGLGSR